MKSPGRTLSPFVACGALLGTVAITLTPTASAVDPVSPAADEWFPSQIQPTENPLYWSRATLEDRVTLDQLGRRPVVDPDKRVWLLACERDIQLDCVESIGLVSPAGEYVSGTFSRGITFDVNNRQGIAPYAEHHQVWNVPGLVIDGVEAQIEIAVGMGGNEEHGFPGLNMGTGLLGVPNRVSAPEGPYGCRWVDQGQCLSPPIFPEGTVLRMVLRLSWLAPSMIGVRGLGVTASTEDLGSGARRITITGSPMLLQSQGGRSEVESGRPAWVQSTFDFGMYDPRIESTPGGECAVDDPIVVANNAQGAGLPTWRSDEGRLDLSMVSPHYWSDGKTEWRGFYETSISGKVARCMWGVDPRVASYLKLEVYDEAGNEKAATTSVGFTDGNVVVRAYDFTFSQSRVSARVNVKVGTRCFTRGIQIRDLICTKKGKKLVWLRRR